MATTDPATGARLINVPGRGQVTEDQFRSMIQNNELAAGPNGSAEQSALSSGNYADPGHPSAPPSGNGARSDSSNSGNAAQTAANNAFGSGPAPTAPGQGPQGARDENVYALRNNDDPTSWAKRVFAQGTADFGPKQLNPYLSDNPLANSPFTQWYQNRYSTSAPTNALVAAELGGQSPDANYTKNAMQTAANGGNLGPADMAGAEQNLRGLKGMLDASAAGGAGLNPTQNLFAGQLMNDPQLATQAATSQLQGVTGGWGMGYLGNMASNLATQYYNDPANRGPQSPNGSFLGQLMKQMGMG